MPRLRHALTSPHLTADERLHLERRLLDERDRVRRTLARLFAVDEGGPDSGRHSDHMAEQGSETAQQQLHAAFASRETATLHEIDAALRRLYRDPPRFGLDEATGQPIAFARLDVLPWARHGSAPPAVGEGASGHTRRRRRADAA